MKTNPSNCGNTKQERLNRINELENLVEKHTRTERHLEQHSDISSDEALECSIEKQKKREEEINSLKSKIIFDDGGPTNEKENIEKNIFFSDGYMNHNADHMSDVDLTNLKNKQENRKDTLHTL